jgi:polyisoprenoid-binding protein YceI
MRLRRSVWLVVVLAVWIPVLAEEAPSSGSGTYQVDRGHTHIGFAVRHFGFTMVRGTFTDFSGVIRYDEKSPEQSSVQVTIKTASIESHNADRDEALRSPAFLDVEKYPEITFSSKRIESRDEKWVAVGDLTMHGVTKEISLPFSMAGPYESPAAGMAPVIGVDATLVIDRQEYGISFHRVLDNGALFVDNEVKIEINIEAILAE